MKQVLATAFWTSLTAYIVFALAEYTRPGFVSYHFSLHWFLLLTIIFAVIWSSVGAYGHTPLRSSSRFVHILSFVAKLVLSFVLFVLLWKEGAVFGDLRIFLALVAAAVPWMLSFEKENHEA